jgi:hypothetical protein
MALSSALSQRRRNAAAREEDFRICDDSQHEKTGSMPIRVHAVAQKAQRRAFEPAVASDVNDSNR